MSQRIASSFSISTDAGRVVGDGRTDNLWTVVNAQLPIATEIGEDKSRKRQRLWQVILRTIANSNVQLADSTIQRSVGLEGAVIHTFMRPNFLVFGLPNEGCRTLVR